MALDVVGLATLLVSLVLVGLVLFLALRSTERDRRITEGLIQVRTEVEQQQRHTEQLRRDLLTLHRGLEQRLADYQQQQTGTLAEHRIQHNRALNELSRRIGGALENHQTRYERRQGEAVVALQETLRVGLGEVRQQVNEALDQARSQLGSQLDRLTETTGQRLHQISTRVDERLDQGFARTTETFSRVLEHLSRIDEAQKKITELSGNVISLQEVLTDKRSRGAFGEVQLAALVRNLLPEGSYAMQHALSNNTRVDCMLFLPEPTGNVAVDAKFPLEAYQRMTDNERAELDRKRAVAQFRQDIRKHIHDIAAKYIVAGETADGAVMFLPAEAVFAEIHARFPELVMEAQRHRVWMVSPTTLMAVLTTARAVLKDEATRRQVHIIQAHLKKLGKDFGRFRQRMDNLGRHIKQASHDVDDITTSARKITGHFDNIENVELDQDGDPGEQHHALPHSGA